MDTQWHHIAISITPGGSAKIYVDGADVSTGTTGPGWFGTTFTLYMGHSRVGSNTFYPQSVVEFPGLMDEVVIWNRTLSLAEVLGLYRRGINRIKFQTRVSNSGCISGHEGTCPAFIGPDGTTATFYTELLNSAITAPSLTLFSSVGKYFQVQSTFETDVSGTYPELQMTTVSH